jgi:hypothetical protein
MEILVYHTLKCFFIVYKYMFKINKNNHVENVKTKIEKSKKDRKITKDELKQSNVLKQKSILDYLKEDTKKKQKKNIFT